MARMVRRALVCALEELLEDDLKKFCNTIREWEIKEGYNRIPRSRLHNKDAEEVVNVIRDFYKDQYGSELTVAVLNDINQRNVAQELEEKLAGLTSISYMRKPQEAVPAPNVVPPSPTPRSEHFVDKQREGLIQGVFLIDPILDSLLSRDLLTDEQYCAIRCPGTPQDKMRRLYSYIRGWGDKDKDFLYEVLKNQNRPLIENLEQS